MHQVRLLLQQAPPLLQRLAHQPDLRVLQVTQAAVNDARRTAGGAGGEVMLLDQKGPPSAARAFPCDGNPVDAAADDDHLKSFAGQGSPDWGSVIHRRVHAVIARSSF